MDMDQILVNSDAMQDWKTRMHDLNEKCAEEVGQIDGYLNTLVNDYFKGDYADSFNESITKFAKTVKSSHEAMGSVEKFLTDIFEVMNKQ